MNTRPSTRRVAVASSLFALLLAVPALAQERKPTEQPARPARVERAPERPRIEQREPPRAQPADRPAIERSAPRSEPRIERRTERESPPRPERGRDLREHVAGDRAGSPQATPGTRWRPAEDRFNREPEARGREAAEPMPRSRSGFFVLPAPEDRVTTQPVADRPDEGDGRPRDRRELDPLPPDSGETGPAPGGPLKAPPPDDPPVSQPPATLPPGNPPARGQPVTSYPWYFGWNTRGLGWPFSSSYRFDGECIDPFGFRAFDRSLQRHWFASLGAWGSAFDNWFYAGQTIGCYSARDRLMSFEESLGRGTDECADVTIDFGGTVGYRFTVALPVLDARNVQEFGHAIHERIQKGETVHLWSTEGVEVKVAPGSFETMRIRRCGES